MRSVLLALACSAFLLGVSGSVPQGPNGVNVDNLAFNQIQVGDGKHHFDALLRWLHTRLMRIVAFEIQPGWSFCNCVLAASFYAWSISVAHGCQAETPPFTFESCQSVAR
jgi:hypothetical protein